MLRSVIIDDEKKSRNALSTLIGRYSEGVTVCAEATNVAQGIRVINEVKPQLVFLDISMPDGTGFDLLDGLDNKDFELIFTTAYSEYAIKAIKMQALDYLLKPINISELQSALNKVQKKVAVHEHISSLPTHDKINSSKQQHPNKIAISVNGGLEFLQFTDIVHLMANGSYTNIYCNDHKMVVSSTPLKEYEEQLPAEFFFRSHHSHIVNLMHIKHFHRGEGGYLIMKDNSEVALARRKRKQFLALFHK